MMDIRVRHFFWKFQFGENCIALGQGISKRFFFSETYISQIFWLQSSAAQVVKAVKFGNFPKSTVFRMPIKHFSTFMKIDSIYEFSVAIRVFWYITRLYLQKKFKFYYQTLKSEYSRNIRLTKKKQFWNPLAEGYKISSFTATAT